MRIESTCDAKKSREFFRNLAASVAQTKQRVGGEMGFSLHNTARDESARNPKHRIFYYDAVSEGRAAIESLENTERGTETFSGVSLHYKVSPTKWRVVFRVGPSSPRRITDIASARIRVKLPLEVISALTAVAPLGVIPSGIHLIFAFRHMQSFVKSEFKKATLETTVLHGVKLGFYGVQSTPLSESFVTVEGLR